MTRVRSSVILTLGFFALAAQTLLFRDFFRVFDGNELGISCFFGSWLAWVGCGAWFGRFETPVARIATRHFELATLVYLPAYLLQLALISAARDMVGIAAYESFPFFRMAIVAGCVNGPISFLTGFLFTRACKWTESAYVVSVSMVFILETLGGCIGGIGVTISLAYGLSAETTFLAVAIVHIAGLSISVMRATLTRRRIASLCGIVPSAQDERQPVATMTAGILLAILAVCVTLIATGIGDQWSRHRTLATWNRLLPEDGFRGAFATPQARYLYGRLEGQFVVMSWGGVCETLPASEHTNEVVALCLAQMPKANRVLVVGPGSLGLCLQFQRLSQVGNVTWLHPDPDYPAALKSVVPTIDTAGMQRLRIPAMDPRRFLEQSDQHYDLVLLNLPPATTLALNRYRSREFFRSIKQHVAPGGVVGLRVTGGENYLNQKTVLLGASALRTLESEFRNVVLKPGDESWLLASDAGQMTTEPAVLRDRLAGIEGMESLYPADGLLSVYLADRIAFQMDAYRRAINTLGDPILLNQDTHPRALLFAVLLAWQRAGTLSQLISADLLVRIVPWAVFVPIVLYGLLRAVYLVAPATRLVKRDQTAAARVFDSYMLILLTGMAGMSLSILLMCAFQAQFGTLFLHVGVISSLFMLGSCVGSVVSTCWMIKRPGATRVATILCIGLNLALLGLLSRSTADAVLWHFGLCFLVAGGVLGAFFPIAAKRLQTAGRTSLAAGSTLELCDHAGGAMGAAITGWLLLPVLGNRMTLLMLVSLVAVHLIPEAIRVRRRVAGIENDAFDRVVRPVAFVIAGIAIGLLMISSTIERLEASHLKERLETIAKTMAPDCDWRPAEFTLPDGDSIPYFIARNGQDESQTYVIETSRLASSVAGYGGPMTLALRVAPDGSLQSLRIVRSNETPSYLDAIAGWLSTLPGHRITDSLSEQGVDTVTGATLTSRAVVQILERSGRLFGSSVLGLSVKPCVPPSRPTRIDRAFIVLSVLLIIAVVSRWFPSRWLRRGLLLATLLLCGFWLNAQYSMQQVISVLDGRWPTTVLSVAFLLIVGVPFVVMLVGNVYCASVCPFGALQELIGDARPKRFAHNPDKQVWRIGRCVKYALLALFVVLFALTRDQVALAEDPLIMLFSPLRSTWVTGVGAVLLVLSVFFNRFWCRNLCPAGAFLALLSSLRILRRWMPTVSPPRCDLGVRTVTECDCLSCDRCRCDES